MGLPTAVTYDMPAHVERPCRANWQFHEHRAALLVHDLQSYFAGVFAPDAPVWRTMLTNVWQLVTAARTHGIPVVYSAQPGDQDPRSRGLLTNLWGPGLSHAGTAIVDEVAPRDDELVLTKHRYSAFVRTDLDQWLAGHGRDQLVVTGLYAHIGVVATATDALMRDIVPFVPFDAVADFTRADHDRALVQLAATGSAVEPTAALLERLHGPGTDTGDGWRVWLTAQLAELLADPAQAPELANDDDANLAESGIDSVRTFTLLDALDAVGVEVDFVSFTQDPRVGTLLAAVEASGVAPPVAGAADPGELASTWHGS